MYLPACVRVTCTVPVTRAASRMLAKSSEKVTVLRGEVLKLECLSQGSPVPVVTWDKYGSYLPEKRVEFKLGAYDSATTSIVSI